VPLCPRLDVLLLFKARQARLACSQASLRSAKSRLYRMRQVSRVVLNTVSCAFVGINLTFKQIVGITQESA
jgi:hypothetical protein